jgi:hypothetical protein
MHDSFSEGAVGRGKRGKARNTTLATSHQAYVGHATNSTNDDEDDDDDDDDGGGGGGLTRVM